jgi:hypothetical protein
VRSKSKDRPLIPKLNLDYSYLEQKCIERDFMEKQHIDIAIHIEQQHQDDDQLVESSQFAMIADAFEDVHHFDIED